MGQNSWTREEAEAAYSDPYNIQAMGIQNSLRPSMGGAWGSPLSGANAQYAKYAGWSTQKIADDLRREGERNKAIDAMLAQQKQPAAASNNDEEQEPVPSTGANDPVFAALRARMQAGQIRPEPPRPALQLPHSPLLQGMLQPLQPLAMPTAQPMQVPTIPKVPGQV